MINPIRIFDATLNLVTELDDYANAYFKRDWSTAGDFSIQTNYNTTHAADLVRGRIVMFDKNVNKCGIITNVTKTLGPEGKGSMIVTASGFELKKILEWRIVPPPSGSEYFTVSNSAETVMKTLVAYNGGSSTVDADRKFSMLEIDTDLDAGLTYLLKTRYTGNVLGLLTECSLATATGFYIYLDLSAKKFRFQTATGVNRTAGQSVNPRAMFSEDYDTIKTATLADNDSNYRNLAYVGGQGEGTARVIQQVFSTTAEPIDMERREMFVDARDLPTTGELDQRGAQKLAEVSTIITTDGAPLSYSPLVYGVDYDLGDYVTLEVYDVARDVQITSIKESWAPNVYAIDVVFDKPPQTVQGQIAGAINGIKSTLATSG